jgi:hypothetical protein
MRKIYLALLVVLIFSVKPTMAQYAEQQVLYKNLPQARYINPGIFPENIGYFTFPALSGYGITATNSGFAFKDLFDANGLSPNNLLSTLANKNYLNVGFVNDIIGFGFRVKKNAFSFNVSPKLDVNLGYNKSLFDFLINGNASYLGKDISLDGFGFDVSSYLETGIGYSREVNEKLDVGGRIKVLLGAANINGDFDGIKLTTNEDDYSLTASSQFSVNAYGTFFADDSIANSLGNPSPVNTGNLGLGIDLGGTYKVSDQLSVFASIVDLGYLKWADYGETLYNDGSSFTFDGIPYNELIGDDSGNSDYLENLGDSLVEEFELSRDQVSYRTQLKTKLYAGADYKFNKYLDGQGMLFGRFYKGKLYPMYMLAGSFHLKKWLTTKITYAGVNGSYNNIGAGLVLHTGPVQLYVMMDNISGLAAVDYARYMSGSFGINFTFKEKEGKISKNVKKEKKAKDKKEKSEKSRDKAEDKKEKSKADQKKAEENKEKASKAKTDALVKKAKADQKQAKDAEKSAKSEDKKIKVQTQKIKAEEKQLNEETKAVKKETKAIRSSSNSASTKTKDIDKLKNTSSNEDKTNEIKRESKSLIIPSSVETSVNDSISHPSFNKPLMKDSAVDVNFSPKSIPLQKDSITK